MTQKKKPISELAFVVSLFVAVFGVFFGILGILGRIPLLFRRKKPPIQRSFQRRDGELRRSGK